MSFKSLSGNSRIIGRGFPQPVPIQLDPAPYEGALAYGQDANVYVSNGTAWVNIGTGPTGATGLQGSDGPQGTQGTYGPGFTIIGSVADVDSGGDPQATLNTAFPSANIGEGVIDQADDELWIYDGTNWINVGSFRGVQGFQGTQGIQGMQGTIGEEGIQGSRGFRGNQGVQGLQGTTGIQGLQGVQGMQGTQGPQGVQGVQGIQGDLGIQGTQGPQSIQGMQGPTGIQGDVGFQGFTGDDAGHVVEMRVKDQITEADPGTGDMIFNSGANPADNFTLVTTIWIDDEAFYGVNLEGLYTAIAAQTSANKGFMKVTKRGNPDDYVIFSIQTATDSTGYWEFGVTFVAGNAVKGDFVELDTPTPGTTTINPVLVAFSLSGDQGIQGVQGPQGTQGVQGVQGIQGNQGTQGPQSVQGVQGNTGIQGLQGLQGLQGPQGTTGLQGVQGLLGLQGVQGDVGVQGFQGTQGFQGFQGIQGFQGAQGFQGTTGFQGDTGFQGLQGIGGNHGGLTFEWNFDSDTGGGNPGTSNFKLNNADITLATTLQIDDLPLDNYSNTIDDLFDYLDANPSAVKGQIFIESEHDDNGPPGHHFVVYEFTNFTWDSGAKSWGEFDINYVESSGVASNDWNTVVADHGAKAIINFIPAGLTGTQGTQGVQGDQGVQGIQGPQSFQGMQGTTGIQGAQGIQGAEGARDFNVTNLSSIAYVIDGVNNPDLKLIRGFTYNFIVNAPGHPFYIKTAATTGTGDLYTSGVTNNGTASGTIVFRVPVNAPATLYYQCEFHGGMGGELQISDLGPQGIQGLQGFQGTDGIQGDVGFQGSTGAGTQGAQGIQGDLGFQGTQGFPGPIGPQGAQGTTGLQGGGGFQGSTGGFGGVTFDYTFSTNIVDSNPGTGTLKFNNSSLPSGSALYINDRDDNFTDIQTYLRTVDDSTSPVKGHFKVSEKTAPENFVIYTISALTEKAGYFDIDCAHVNGSVNSFTDGEDVIITFARTGDIGPVGPQGVQGFEGFQGAQGAGGILGAQGVQGFQGMQGGPGPQGTPGFIGGDGIQGDSGFQGVQGPQGTDGSDGNEGIQGFTGIQGPQGTGAQGVQGDAGPQGIAGIGATGIQGFQGIQGDALQGHQGIQGLSGPPGFGNQGFQGFQGPQGTTGSEGSQGLQGLAGQGTSGLQGIQGIDGDDGLQGAQGITGDGNQGTQGFQGAAGIGNTGVQGNDGNQGVQGIIGESGVGGTQGVQGFDGNQGTQGIDGGLGNDGPQGAQGTQGDFGFQGPAGPGSQGIQGGQGTQGSLGIQGFPGQGTQGLQGIQAAQGIQGERGFQGLQGVQGPGIDGGVSNLQNVHETSVQDTALFLAMFEGGATERPLLGTTGPNPGGESNFFYTSDVDELTVENIQVEGNLTVVGTITGGSYTQGGTSAFHLGSDQPITFGSTAGNHYVAAQYITNQTSWAVSANTSITSSIKFTNYDASTTIFDFNMSSGNFTASGDINTNSDERLKENIETVENALDKVTALRGVYFDMKANPGVRKLGLIAQEVEEIIPEVVSIADDEMGTKSVAYANMVGLLIEAIKDLKDEVDQLKGQ